MGVEFNTCPVCKTNYPDCGVYFTCYDGELGGSGCEESFCSTNCGKPVTTEGKISCVKCRGEWASDKTLLEFLLARSGLSRNQLLAMFVAAHQSPKTES